MRYLLDDAWTGVWNILFIRDYYNKATSGICTWHVNVWGDPGLATAGLLLRHLLMVECWLKIHELGTYVVSKPHRLWHATKLGTRDAFSQTPTTPQHIITSHHHHNHNHTTHHTTKPITRYTALILYCVFTFCSPNMKPISIMSISNGKPGLQAELMGTWFRPFHSPIRIYQMARGLLDCPQPLESVWKSIQKIVQKRKKKPSHN